MKLILSVEAAGSAAATVPSLRRALYGIVTAFRDGGCEGGRSKSEAGMLTCGSGSPPVGAGEVRRGLIQGG